MKSGGPPSIFFLGWSLLGRGQKKEKSKRYVRACARGSLRHEARIEYEVWGPPSILFLGWSLLGGDRNGEIQKMRARMRQGVLEGILLVERTSARACGNSVSGRLVVKSVHYG